MMKHTFLILLLSLIACFHAGAQEGLNLPNQPGGKLAPKIRIEVKGRRLKPYKLTKYLSVTYEATSTAIESLDKAIRKDAQAAYDKEVGNIGGHVYYAFLCLKPHDKDVRRYVFYRNSSLSARGKNEATYIYMEGYATLDELKSMFK